MTFSNICQGLSRIKDTSQSLSMAFQIMCMCLLGLKPAMALSDLVRDVKNNSTNFINDHGWVKGKFSWQEGYGAFSYSNSQIENVYNYILNQEKHHGKQKFQDEYLDFLKKFEIEHDVKYLFEWME